MTAWAPWIVALDVSANGLTLVSASVLTLPPPLLTVALVGPSYRDHCGYIGPAWIMIQDTLHISKSLI